METNRYIITAGKRLRCGYTTGTCAAAAARAAITTLLSGQITTQTEITLPDGERLALTAEAFTRGADFVRCAVRKDAGDDIDATDGLFIFAEVRLNRCGKIVIDGGEGVGRVTRSGLEQPIGAAAINRVPRLMITQELRDALADAGCDSGVGAAVTISVPNGEKIAKRTYNARLGITGGISILGTTGIVAPMSERALIDTIHVELEVLRAAGSAPILMTPGNYGETFARETLELKTARSVLCSNFLGETLDFVSCLGFEGLLLVGHIGKLIKLSGGIFNTHSHTADARMEILTAHAALAGADTALAQDLLNCLTTDEALTLLDRAGILEQVMCSAGKRAEWHIKRRLGDMPAGLILFSNVRGVLWKNQDAEILLERMKNREENG